MRMVPRCLLFAGIVFGLQHRVALGGGAQAPIVRPQAAVDDDPVPDGPVDGLSLRTVKLPTLVRDQIEKFIFDAMDGPLNAARRRELEGAIPVERLIIGPGRRWLWELSAPPSECGAHGNCEIWLFDPATGAPMLDDGNGQGPTILPAVHNGWHDIEIYSGLSCCEGARTTYRFDGHRYRLAKNVIEKYGDPE